jgi:hypothetical protein
MYQGFESLIPKGLQDKQRTLEKGNVPESPTVGL